MAAPPRDRRRRARRRIAATVALASLLGFAGCDVSGELAAIREQNTAILAKLDQIEAKQDALAAGDRRPAQAPAAEDEDAVYDIPLGDSPIRGNPDAAVTIVEFSDFQCPYCARTQPLLRDIAAKYPDRVRFVYKHFPLSFHPAALPLALASVAAQDQGKFWEFRRIVFERQAEIQQIQEDQQALSDAILRYAREAGIDLAELARDINESQERHRQRIQADLEAGRAANVRGTPSLYINGRKVPGRERNLEGLSARIEAALDEAATGS